MKVRARHWLHVHEVPAGRRRRRSSWPVDAKRRIDRGGDIFRVNRPVLVPIESGDLAACSSVAPMTRPPLHARTGEHAAAHRGPMVAALDVSECSRVCARIRPWPARTFFESSEPPSCAFVAFRSWSRAAKRWSSSPQFGVQPTAHARVFHAHPCRFHRCRHDGPSRPGSPECSGRPRRPPPCCAR